MAAAWRSGAAAIATAGLALCGVVAFFCVNGIPQCLGGNAFIFPRSFRIFLSRCWMFLGLLFCSKQFLSLTPGPAMTSGLAEVGTDVFPFFGGSNHQIYIYIYSDHFQIAFPIFPRVCSSPLLGRGGVSTSRWRMQWRTGHLWQLLRGAGSAGSSSCKELQKKGYLPRLDDFDEDLRGLDTRECVRMRENAESLKELGTSWKFLEPKMWSNIFQGWIYDDLFQKGPIACDEGFWQMSCCHPDQLLPHILQTPFFAGEVEEKLPDLEDLERPRDPETQRPGAGCISIATAKHRKDLEEVEKKLENVFSPKVALNWIYWTPRVSQSATTYHKIYTGAIDGQESTRQIWVSVEICLQQHFESFLPGW